MIVKSRNVLASTIQINAYINFFPVIGTGVPELLKWASLGFATTEEQAVLLWYPRSSYCILIVPKSLVATLVVLHFWQELAFT